MVSNSSTHGDGRSRTDRCGNSGSLVVDRQKLTRAADSIVVAIPTIRGVECDVASRGGSDSARDRNRVTRDDSHGLKKGCRATANAVGEERIDDATGNTR